MDTELNQEHGNTWIHSIQTETVSAFEGVLQLDTKFAKVSYVPGDHRESVNDGLRGDHGVLGDGV